MTAGKILFLDESGDHNITVIDPQYPVFVLGGVIMDREYAEGQLADALDEFKPEIFGNTDIVLHTADIARNRNGFEDMQDETFRNHFYNRINELMRSLPYSVVACVVHKEEYLSRYGVVPIDPYLFSLGVLIEMFCFDIGSRGDGGIVIAERRDPTLDRGLELAWLNLKEQGTRRHPGRTVEERISSLTLRDKKENIPGLQLADLVVSPIGRHVLGKPDKDDWEIVNGKFRRSPRGRVDRYGLVILPRQRRRPAPATQ